jgi:hypothetical protein
MPDIAEHPNRREAKVCFLEIASTALAERRRV